MLFWSVFDALQGNIEIGTTLHLGNFGLQYKENRYYITCKQILYAAINYTKKMLRPLSRTDSILQKKKYEKKPNQTQYKIKCFFQE